MGVTGIEVTGIEVMGIEVTGRGVMGMGVTGSEVTGIVVVWADVAKKFAIDVSILVKYGEKYERNNSTGLLPTLFDTM